MAPVSPAHCPGIGTRSLHGCSVEQHGDLHLRRADRGLGCASSRIAGRKGVRVYLAVAEWLLRTSSLLRRPGLAACLQLDSSPRRPESADLPLTLFRTCPAST